MEAPVIAALVVVRACADVVPCRPQLRPPVPTRVARGSRLPLRHRVRSPRASEAKVL